MEDIVEVGFRLDCSSLGLRTSENSKVVTPDHPGMNHKSHFYH